MIMSDRTRKRVTVIVAVISLLALIGTYAVSYL